MKCKKCSSTKYVKYGYVCKKQRYLCKVCGCQFTNTTQGMPVEMKKLAIKMYLEGLGFRAIGRVLSVSNVAVLKWMRRLGEAIEKLRTEAKEDKNIKFEIVELDEMWHFIAKKKRKIWIWLAVTRDFKIIEWQMGSRGEETGAKLWKKNRK